MMKPQVKQLIDQTGTDVSGKWLSLISAELLVEQTAKQCIEFIENTMGKSSAAAKQIKEHFGIE